VSEYSFFLASPQAAWIESADYHIEEIVLQERAKERKLFFSASPNEQTAKLNIVPNVGSQVSLIHSESSGSLGVASTCYALIDGTNCPIEQSFEIYLNRDFFNDIYALRGAKLHLHVKCGIATVDDTDFKQEPIIWFRVSLLPPAEQTSQSSLWARLFK